MRLKFTRFAVATAAAIIAAVGATQAGAHVTAIGYKTLMDGSVDFWIGTYHSQMEPPMIEGSLVLTGPGAAGPYAFTVTTGVDPSLDDVIFASGENYSTTIAWQGVNVSGLTDGAFTADITGTSSVKWERDGFLSWPATFNIDVADVPEPATFALFGIGLAGIGVVRLQPDHAS